MKKFTFVIAALVTALGAGAVNAQSSGGIGEIIEGVAREKAPELAVTGYAYWRGDGVEKDERKAVDLLTEAAMQGSALGAGQLGHIYWKGGDVIAKDKVEATAWNYVAGERGLSSGGQFANLVFGHMSPDEKVGVAMRVSEINDAVKAREAEALARKAEEAEQAAEAARQAKEAECWAYDTFLDFFC